MRNYGFGPKTESDRYGYNGYENWVNDVTMYLDMITRRTPPDDAVFHFTILVDYAPVEFEYARWLDGRSGKKETGTTTHLSIPVEDRIEQLDFVIPKEAFGEERERIGVYPITTVVRIYSPSNERFRTSSFRRFILYYGATHWPDVPCREHYPSAEWTSVEKRLFRHATHSGTMYVFPAKQRHSYEVGDTVEAEPGEEIPVNLSIHHYGGEAQPGGALVPFFGAEMAHDMWMYKDGVRREEADGRIGYRRQFVVEAPRKSGTYNLYVGYWPEAYEPARDYWGKHFENKDPKTAPGFASNVIPVHVN